MKIGYEIGFKLDTGGNIEGPIYFKVEIVHVIEL